MRSLSAVCSELLEDNGLTLEDIDLFIPHQANLRIIEAVGDRLKLGSEKIFVNLDEYGNTSAASIPLGIGDACAQGRIRPGSRVLLRRRLHVGSRIAGVLAAFPAGIRVEF